MHLDRAPLPPHVQCYRRMDRLRSKVDACGDLWKEADLSSVTLVRIAVDVLKIIACDDHVTAKIDHLLGCVVMIGAVRRPEACRR